MTVGRSRSSNVFPEMAQSHRLTERRDVHSDVDWAKLDLSF